MAVELNVVRMTSMSGRAEGMLLEVSPPHLETEQVQVLGLCISKNWDVHEWTVKGWQSCLIVMKSWKLQKDSAPACFRQDTQGGTPYNMPRKSTPYWMSYKRKKAFSAMPSGALIMVQCPWLKKGYLSCLYMAAYVCLYESKFNKLGLTVVVGQGKDYISQFTQLTLLILHWDLFSKYYFS